jgi:hypothetical protein
MSSVEVKEEEIKSFTGFRPSKGVTLTQEDLILAGYRLFNFFSFFKNKLKPTFTLSSSPFLR